MTFWKEEKKRNWIQMGKSMTNLDHVVRIRLLSNKIQYTSHQFTWMDEFDNEKIAEEVFSNLLKTWVELNK